MQEDFAAARQHAPSVDLMIGSGGDLRMFWSNGLVCSITTLALILLFWPLLGHILENMGRRLRPRQA